MCESLDMMWSEKYGRPMLQAAMPLKRFLVFLSCCRFDDKATRKEKQSVDKLAPIRLMMDDFVDKCAKAYTTSRLHRMCVLMKRSSGSA